MQIIFYGDFAWNVEAYFFQKKEKYFKMLLKYQYFPYWVKNLGDGTLRLFF